MFFIIYKTTNKINGKYYVGKHQTTDLNDSYMGSGKLIKKAIKKYGAENFTKEILHVFETEEEMNAKEKELVTVSEETYNLCEGGKGGWGYCNKEIWTKEKRHSHNKRVSGFKTLTETERQKNGTKGGQKRAEKLKTLSKEEWNKMFSSNGFKGKHHSEESKAKIGKSNSNKIPWNKGKPRTEEEKQKIRNSIMKKYVSEVLR